MTKSFGTCLALSVAGLFVASCDKDHSKVATEKDPAALGPGATPMDVTKAAPKASAGDTVQCVGIHECKGKSACHIIGSHACAGQNACKGKGWIEVPRAECDAKGGKVLDS